MTTDYGFFSRLLHRMALASDAVPSVALDLESRCYQPLPAAGPPVYVCGLARAGTTLLMRLLHGTGQFNSLTYRDMPFVLAPNAWARLRGKTVQHQAAERAHGDGLTVDADSPEALEEVFWRVHCRDLYIHRDRLATMAADEDTLAAYRTWVGLVLRCHGGGRYLAKNNNNLLRLPSLRRAFPGAVLLVPFRDPLAQARSLLAQHRRFTALQREDAFVARYMTWLVHHEFGLDHRPFAWGGEPPAGQGLSTDSLDYWLAQWCAAYRFVLDQEVDVVLVDYDALCGDPPTNWSRIAGWVGLSIDATLTLAVREAENKDERGCDANMLARVREIHAALKDAAG